MVEVSLWRKAQDAIPNLYLLSNVLAKRIKQLSRKSEHSEKDANELEKIALQEIVDGKIQVVAPAADDKGNADDTG